MNEITPSNPLQRALSPEVASRHITSFTKRFKQAHLYLAYHAAFPLTLTPDLLYRLRAKFRCDIYDEQLNIPWVAVADLLLSSLCNEVSHELYEINVTVRNELLKRLKADSRFGEQRINELSDFLLVYIKQQLLSHDPDVRDLAKAQRWTALAYTESKLAAHELALALRSSLRQNHRAQQLRMASLIETFAEPLQGFAPLLTYARGVAYLVHGDMENARSLLNAAAGTELIEKELGVRLPTLVTPSGSVKPRDIVLADATSSSSQLPSGDLGSSIGSDSPSAVSSEYALPQPILAQSDRVIKKIIDGFSPFIKCVCPSCFEEIYLGECKIVSGRTTGKVLKAPSKGPFARMKVEPLDGPKYTLELARRECPACGYLLPSNIELVPSITLAVIGDTFSGKSHYIAALIHQIKADWMGNANGFARFTCLTPEVEDAYTRDYFEPLFINKQVIPLTQPATKMTADPLIYKLAVSPSPKDSPIPVNLMIYDTSGEDFARQDRLVQFARFVLNANAIIFVADPFTMPSIFGELSPSLQARLQLQFNLAQRRRAAESLNSIIDVFERYRGYSGSSLSDTPVAVMLSKADLLNYLINTSKSYAFMRNPQYGSDLDLQDINAVGQEVKSLLKAYQQGDLLAATKRFKRVKFFATSATGEPPDATGHFTKVEPCRCLDPVLWILYQFGIIKASK